MEEGFLRDAFLEGLDDEWEEIGDKVYQRKNKREGLR
jgi:hypothetical protein